MTLAILDKQYDAMMHPRIAPHPLYVAHTPEGDITLQPGRYTTEQIDCVRDCIAAAVAEHLPPIKQLGLLYRRANKYWFDWHSKPGDDDRMAPTPYRSLPHV